MMNPGKRPKQAANTGAISLGAIIDALGPLSGGMMLTLPALVIILPVSMIPGVSPLCALLALLAAFHIFFGRDEMWLPQRIREIPLSKTWAERLIDSASRLSAKADRFSRPRLAFLATGLPRQLAIAAAVLLCLASLVFGFLPLVDTLLMAPVLFFGLGIRAGDGLLVFAGWMLLAATAGGMAGLLA